MKKRALGWILCVVLLMPCLVVTASADCGPKPSTTVTVRGGGGERMILTLLAETDGNGPYGCIEPDGEPASYMAKDDWQEEAWYAFRDYAAADAFYFWGEVFPDTVNWSYYPPETFKIAVYYPDYDVMLVSSEVFERYAFHSDFTVYLPAITEDTVSGTVDMELRGGLDWMEELFGFLMRVVVTLAVELSLARLWGFKEKKQRKTILCVNLVTQIGLNVLLTMWYILDGPLNAMLRLVIAEIGVLIAESWLYLKKLRQEESTARIVSYAAAANLLSVWLGFVLL